MKKTHFEKLEVYRLSEQLSDEVWQIATGWNALAQQTIGAQIVRAADSVGADISEGSGRGSNNDYVRFLRMSRGSLYETRHWLRRAFKRNLLSPEQIKALSPLIEKLTPMLNAYIRSIGTYQPKADSAKRN